MADSGERNNNHSIALFMVVIVGLAIVIIAALTITAIMAGPPQL